MLPRLTRPPVQRSYRRPVLVLIALLAVIAAGALPFGLTAANVADSLQPTALNTRPVFIRDPIIKYEFDGTSDDLLTGGLGATGLQSGPAPTLSAPPTARELRRLTIYNNYRALVDTTDAGGYGTLYGPTVGVSGTDDGKIAGKEYLAYADDGNGIQNVTMMVQIPASFNPASPCLVTAPSSGSRGVYGAIGTAGEWGLKRGCAVAYTDKGGGTGFHDLDSDTVTLIDGQTTAASLAGTQSHFTAPGVTADFLAANPHRLAFKHAHSQQNPEADWGKYVLQSIEFAFYILNLPENYGQATAEGVQQTITPDNTVVIASSVSNGGAASLLAAEQDSMGLIDGVAVSEPNINPAVAEQLVIRQGEREWRAPNLGRALFDYITLLLVYQPCANLNPALPADAPFLGLVPPALAEQRCNDLAALGLLSGATTAERATEAQAIINAYGMLSEQNLVQPSHYNLGVVEGVAVLYAYTYGRFSVADNLCNYSYAGVDSGTPAALPAATLSALFATGNGIPATGGVQIIDNNSQGGPRVSAQSLNSAGVADLNLDGALCLRSLATGVDVQGNPLSGVELEKHLRVMQGIAAVRASGDLNGKPAVIVHGRNDALIHPNYTSRAYYGLNEAVEGADSRLYYYEVENAQHFDAFLPFPGFNNRFVPLHYYFNQALDLMYDHLANGTALPVSQVVRATPRGDGAPPITTANVPPIVVDPTVNNRVLFGDGGSDLSFQLLEQEVHLPVVVR